MINARAETAADKPAFRAAFAAHPLPDHRRRLLRVAAQLDSGRKQAFHITPPDHEPFAFAGLWSVWHPPAGDAGGRPSAAAIDDPRPPEATMSQPDPLVRDRHHRREPSGRRPARPHAGDPHRDAEPPGSTATTPAPMLADVILHDRLNRAHRAPGGRPGGKRARYDGPECLAEPAGSADPLADTRRAERLRG